MADSDLQITREAGGGWGGGGGEGGVLPVIAYMGRFRGFRLKGVFFVQASGTNG